MPADQGERIVDKERAREADRIGQDVGCFSLAGNLMGSDDEQEGTELTEKSLSVVCFLGSPGHAVRSRNAH